MTELSPMEQERPPQVLIKAHRGVPILIMGILGIALIPFCQGCVMFSLPLSIIAWVMGNKDLFEMRQGLMDRSGENITNAGRICGIVGVLLSILAAILLLLFMAIMIIMAIVYPEAFAD